MAFPSRKRIAGMKLTGSPFNLAAATPDPPQPAEPPKEATKKTVPLDDTAKKNGDRRDSVRTAANSGPSYDELFPKLPTVASAQNDARLNTQEPPSISCKCASCPAEQRVEELEIQLQKYKRMVAAAEGKARTRDFVVLNLQDPVHYWNNVAETLLESRLLVARLHLQFPKPGMPAIYSKPKYPVFRLIATGEDTPHNIAILLGPHWEETISEDYKAWRLEALVFGHTLPLGHPEFTERMQLCTDLHRWKPREPTVAEDWCLNKFGKMAHIKCREVVHRRGTKPKERV